MNEKIRELAEQAQAHAEYVTPNGLEWLDIFREKFAELVVQECLALCKTAVGTPDYNRGRMDCHDNIKEVFKVEERKRQVKYYRIIFPGKFGQYIEETWSEDQILESFYKDWCMLTFAKIGRAHV